MQRSRTRPMPIRLLLVLAAALACLVTATPAMAEGTYSVTAGSTSTFPGWYSPQHMGEFRASASRIDTGAGSYPSGSWRRWRMLVPTGIEIAGGRLVGTLATPNADIAGVIREGTFGGAVRTLLRTTESRSLDLALAGNANWIDFGLEAVRSTTATSSGANYLRVSSLTLQLSDPAPPTVTVDVEPDPIRFIGPSGCASWSVRGADTGGGIVAGKLTNLTTGQDVDAWTYPIQAGLRPGIATISRDGCVAVGTAVHGTNVFRLRLQDASGRIVDATMRARFDLEGPTITGLPDANHLFELARPVLAVECTDADSGMDTVVATFDGSAATASRDGTHLTITPTRPLDVGLHVLAVTARDQAGNALALERTIVIADNTPPAITVSAPGDSGTSTPWLSASARDDGSEIDPAGWLVLVDGAPVGMIPVGTGIAGPLGMLTAGTHTITVMARDAAGNVATAERAYLVVGPDDGRPTGEVAVGSSSGLWVVQAPTSLNRGDRGSIMVLAASSGRPLENFRIELQMNGRVLGAATTDATGMAAITWVANLPGRASLVAPGTVLAARTVAIRVAPRVVLRAFRRQLTAGSTATVKGAAGPVMAGRRVMITARIGGIWVPVGRPLRTGSGGQFRTTVTSAVRGRIAIRASMPAAAGWEAATSNIVNLTVR